MARREMNQFRIKPGREASLFTAAVAVVMGIFGLVVVVPAFSGVGGSFGPVGSIAPAFAIVWALAAFGIAAFYAYNAFSERGAAIIDIDMASGPTAPDPGGSQAPERPPVSSNFEPRLRQIESLRRDGLITEAEYQAKRAEILAERW